MATAAAATTSTDGAMVSFSGSAISATTSCSPSTGFIARTWWVFGRNAVAEQNWIVHGKPFTPPCNKGVKEFISFVKDIYDEDRMVLCPCRQCLNHTRIPFGLLHRHLLIQGISNTYTRWIHHGEPLDLVVHGDVDNDNNGGHEPDNNGGHEADSASHENQHIDTDDVGEVDGGDSIPELLQDLSRATDEAEAERRAAQG
ncbi:hypothetical protein ACQ4PT_023027 [Festuca glaucescens]